MEWLESGRGLRGVEEGGRGGGVNYPKMNRR